MKFGGGGHTICVCVCVSMHMPRGVWEYAPQENFAN